MRGYQGVTTQSRLDHDRQDKIMVEFDDYLKNEIHRFLNGKLRDMALYHMGWLNENFAAIKSDNRGKRGRPMLAILTYLLFGDEYNRVFPIAAAIEILHNSTLVFDDIQDRDLVRRGRPAVWTLWGTDEAINLGSALQAMTLPALSAVSQHVGRVRAQSMQSFLSQVMLELAMGQQQDIEWTKRHTLPSSREYLKMVECKTASLFRATTGLSAAASGVDRKVRVSFERFGQAVGMSFQVFDDVLGIWGSRDRGLDKPNFDLQNRKKTYPFIAGMGLARSEERRLLERYYQMEIVDETILSAVMDLLNRLDMKMDTLHLGLHYLNDAIRILQGHRVNDTVTLLIMEWIQYIVNKQVGTLIDVSPLALGRELMTWELPS